MPQPTIKYAGVVNLAKSLGFSFVEVTEHGPVMRYASPSKFVMEFTVQWLTKDGEYPLDQVRQQLTAMKNSALMDEKVFIFLSNQDNVDAISKACLDFGMVYDKDDERFYYVVKKKALFTVDHDYIASLICTGKASMDTLHELLETFKETAEFEHGRSEVASGKSLLRGKGKHGKGKREA